MTQDEDRFHITGPDGRHPVRPGDEHLVVKVGPIRHKIPAIVALRLGDALSMAASRALSSGVHNREPYPHGHHWSDEWVDDG